MTSSSDRLPHDLKWRIAHFVGHVGANNSCSLALSSKAWYSAISTDAFFWSRWQRSFGLQESEVFDTLAQQNSDTCKEEQSRSLAIRQLQKITELSSFSPRLGYVSSCSEIDDAAAKYEKRFVSTILMSRGNLLPAKPSPKTESETTLSGGDDHDTFSPKEERGHHGRPNEEEAQVDGGVEEEEEIQLLHCQKYSVLKNFLKRLWLPELDRVTELSTACLGHYIRLQILDLSNLTKIKRIGACFCFKCMSLVKVRFGSMESLLEIGDEFLNECARLEELVFGSLPALTSIGKNFVSRCRKVETLEIIGAKSLQTIGANFCIECDSLERLIFTNRLESLTSIGPNFCSDTKKLVSAQGLRGCSNLTTIGEFFLRSRESLSGTLDLSGMTSLNTLHADSFFAATIGTRAVVNLDFTGIKGVTFIPDDSFSESKFLKFVTLAEMSDVASIGKGVLRSCPSLETVNLKDMTALTQFGEKFLHGCPKLQLVDFAGLSNVITIEGSFLSDCPALESIDLSSMSQVASVGGADHKMLAASTRLKSVKLNPALDSKVNLVLDEKTGFYRIVLNQQGICCTIS